MHRLDSGAAQLRDGAASAVTQIPQLVSGTRQVPGLAHQVPDGYKAADAGLSTLTDGTVDVRSALADLSSSTGLLDAALHHGARVDRLFGETADGSAVMDMRYRELDPRMFGLGMQRGALFSLLDSAWREERHVHCGRRIISVDAERGLLRDGDGAEHGPFDLLILADGAASRLRGSLVEAALDRLYPWGAQWCLVAKEQWPFESELRQRYVRARRMVGMLPVVTRPGDTTPRMSFFWSLPGAALDSPGEDAQWRADVAAVWPQAAESLRHTPFPHGLAAARYRDAVHARWYRGRAVLLGDCAHERTGINKERSEQRWWN